MYCTKCGTELPDDAVFCRNCGGNLKASSNKRPIIRKPRFVVAFAVIITIIIAVISLIVSNNSKKLGNPQAIPAENNFCCQTKNTTFFTVPGSKEILTYVDGTVSSAFITEYYLDSIYDFGTSLIVSGYDEEDNDCFVMVNKTTGEEVEIRKFSGEYAEILNVINGVIYYETISIGEENPSKAKVYSYNINTRANQFITNGISCISEEGIYNVKGNTGNYELWFYKLKNPVSKTGRKLCDISQSWDWNDTKILKCYPLREADGRLYFNMLCSINGHEGYHLFGISKTLLSRMSLEEPHWEVYPVEKSFNVLNGYAYYIDGLFNTYGDLCRSELISGWSSIITKEIVVAEEDYINGFCVFQDSTNPRNTIIAIWNCYSTITFWDEYGNKITEYKENH